MPRASPKHSCEVHFQRSSSSLCTGDYRASGREDPDKTAEFSWTKPGILLKFSSLLRPMVLYWRRFHTQASLDVGARARHGPLSMPVGMLAADGHQQAAYLPARGGGLSP
jgi:hypothetical protein